MRILVTGGKGFIGSHLVNYLTTKGHWVRSVDIKKDCLLETNENSARANFSIVCQIKDEAI